MDESELQSLLLVLSRAIERGDKEQKRSAFEDVRTYALTHEVAQGVMNLLLLQCARDGDIRHLGVRIVTVVSLEALGLYREALILCADCATLLYLTRVTMQPLTRNEIVALGHKIQLHAPKMSLEDFQKLSVAALDTFLVSGENVPSLDQVRFMRQLKHSSVYAESVY